LLSQPDGIMLDSSQTHLPDIVDFSHTSSAAGVEGDGDLDIWVTKEDVGIFLVRRFLRDQVIS
jgi:hypothetical protein